MFYQYDDSQTVRIFDAKIIDIRAQIVEVKNRVDELEKWRAKKKE